MFTAPALTPLALLLARDAGGAHRVIAQDAVPVERAEAVRRVEGPVVAGGLLPAPALAGEPGYSRKKGPCWNNSFQEQGDRT